MKHCETLLDDPKIDDETLNQRLLALRGPMAEGLSISDARLVEKKLWPIDSEPRSTVTKLRTYLRDLPNPPGIMSHGVGNHPSFDLIERWRKTGVQEQALVMKAK